MDSASVISKHLAPRTLPLPSRNYPPAMAGMVMAVAILAREPLLICLKRLFTRRRRSIPEQAARMLSLPSLRAAIIGHSRQYIVQMFGPPPAACDGRCPIWYYPLHAPEGLAMAISFHDEKAAMVEFFHAPQTKA